MDQLHSSLNSLKLLRLNVGQIFEALGGGIRIEHGEEHGENKFLHELQELLTSTNSHLRFVLRLKIRICIFIRIFLMRFFSTKF